MNTRLFHFIPLSHGLERILARPFAAALEIESGPRRYTERREKNVPISERMLRENLNTKLETQMAKAWKDATPQDMYQALSLLTKDYMSRTGLKPINITARTSEAGLLFSLEFLLARCCKSI